VTVLVVDLSSNNPHPIDYPAVRQAGVGGAIIKLTEGGGATAYVNPYATVDLDGFRSVGLPVAGYHFLQPTTPVAEQLGLLEGNLHGVGMVWVDSELQEGPWPSVTNATRAMCDAIAAAGLRAGLYSSPSFLSHLAGAPWGYPLWLADYGVPSPPMASALWQYTDAGTIAGIGGKVDLSRFFGTGAELASLFARPAPSPVPGPPPPGPTKEEEMVWLDTDPNNGDAILVVPGRGGWYGISAETLAYYRDNGVPEARHHITKALFAAFQKLG
jgi:GH25 family lysozyme M1 (1,4-beta-N-acetylmuramidase)